MVICNNALVVHSIKILNNSHLYPSTRILAVLLKVEAARTAPAPSLAGLTAWDKIIVTSVLHDNSNDSDKDNYNDKYLFDDDYHILPDGARAELVDEICLSLQCSILRRTYVTPCHVMSRHDMSCHVT